MSSTAMMSTSLSVTTRQWATWRMRRSINVEPLVPNAQKTRQNAMMAYALHELSYCCEVWGHSRGQASLSCIVNAGGYEKEKTWNDLTSSSFRICYRFRLLNEKKLVGLMVGSSEKHKIIAGGSAGSTILGMCNSQHHHIFCKSQRRKKFNQSTIIIKQIFLALSCLKYNVFLLKILCILYMWWSFPLHHYVCTCCSFQWGRFMVLEGT